MPSYLGEVSVLIVTSVFAYMALQMKLGSFSMPGPGLWPFILCLVIISLSSIAAIANYQGKNMADFDIKGMRKPFIAAVSIGFYAFFMKLIGYVIPTIVLMMFWLKFLGGETWCVTIILSILITAIFWLVFSYFLGVPFPREIFLI